jgi:uncharacterized protein YcfJ
MKNTVRLALCMLTAAASLPVAASENVSYSYADVLRVDPVYETVRFREPQEECYEQPVVYRERGRSSGGAVAGAIIGGVLGSQVGSGDGRRAATVAGALIGGAVGHDAGKRNGRPGREYETTEQRCEVVEVEREERRIAGYDVEYRLKGDVFFSRLAYDPGNKLRVRVAVSPAD